MTLPIPSPSTPSPSSEEMRRLEQIASRRLKAAGEPHDRRAIKAMVAEADWHARKTYDPKRGEYVHYVAVVLKNGSWAKVSSMNPTRRELNEARRNCESACPGTSTSSKALMERINQARYRRLTEELRELLIFVAKPNFDPAEGNVSELRKAVKEKLNVRVATFDGASAFVLTASHQGMSEERICAEANRLLGTIGKSHGGAVSMGDVDEAVAKYLGDAPLDFEPESPESALAPADGVQLRRWLAALTRRQRRSVLLHLEGYQWLDVAAGDLLVEHETGQPWELEDSVNTTGGDA